MFINLQKRCLGICRDASVVVTNICGIKKEFVKVSRMFSYNEGIVLLSTFFFVVVFLNIWKISHGICNKFKVLYKKKKKTLRAKSIPESFKKTALHPHLLHVTPEKKMYAHLCMTESLKNCQLLSQSSIKALL